MPLAGYSSRISDLLQRQGEIGANARLQQGQAWGNTISNLGQIAAAIPGQIQQSREMADTKRAEDETKKGLAFAHEAARRFLRPDGQPDWMKVSADVRGAGYGVIADEIDKRAQLQRTNDLTEKKTTTEIAGMNQTQQLAADKAAADAKAKADAAQREASVKAILAKYGTPEAPIRDWSAPINDLINAGFTDEAGKFANLSHTLKPEDDEVAVTVPGPNGRPVRKLVKKDQLRQGVEEYREPKAPRVPTYQWATSPDGTDKLMTPDEIRSTGARRPGAVSDASMPPAFSNALGRALLSVTAQRRTAATQLANRLWQEGNENELKGLIQQAAIEGENVDTKNQVLGRQATMASLQDTRNILNELKAKNVPTGWLTGNVEDLYRKLGKSSNPEYVALGNRLAGTLINYRRAATGVAFGEKEGAAYEKMFPNYRNDLPVNLALIDGLEREMRTYDKTYWEHKLGADGAALILGKSAGKGGDAPPPGWTIKPNGGG